MTKSAMREKWLGCLGLLARSSIALRDTRDETAESLRSDIEQALDDGVKAGLIRYRRIIDRIEIWLP